MPLNNSNSNEIHETVANDVRADVSTLYSNSGQDVVLSATEELANSLYVDVVVRDGRMIMNCSVGDRVWEQIVDPVPEDANSEVNGFRQRVVRETLEGFRYGWLPEISDSFTTGYATESISHRDWRSSETRMDESSYPYEGLSPSEIRSRVMNQQYSFPSFGAFREFESTRSTSRNRGSSRIEDAEGLAEEDCEIPF